MVEFILIWLAFAVWCGLMGAAIAWVLGLGREED